MRLVPHRPFHLAAVALAALAAAACAGAPRRAAPTVTPAAAAIVAAPDRTEEDRARDWSRRPGELLAFLEVKPGMRVAEIGAADGYTAELLARAVGPAGTVYAQNTKTMLIMIDALWPDRLARPVMANVVRVDREFEDPLPPEAANLDLIVLYATYHDTVWLELDRARMNRALAAALRPGGKLVVVDHSAAPGGGKVAAYDFHRVEEAVVKAELEAAGLRLEASSDYQRNPADTRDWSTAPNEADAAHLGTSDRFALRFVKP